MLARRRRSAFTLIELLVVVAIIGLLVALSATAVFSALAGQTQKNTEATLNKLDEKLRKKLEDIRAQVNSDYENNRAEAVAFKQHPNLQGRPDLIKAVMTYGRTRQQLPMTFSEANIAPSPNNYFTVCGHRYYSLPAFKDLPVSGSGDVEESAACFYAAVAQDGLVGLENQQGTSSTGHKVFVDSWGKPIAFVRYGYGGSSNEIAGKRNYDPFYPAKNASTGAYRNLKTDYGTATFDADVWNVVRPTVTWAPNVPPANGYDGTSNHTAFVVSSGPSKKFFETSPATTLYTDDNLFSYRLRKEGAGGD